MTSIGRLAARIREVLHYDPLTGAFAWKVANKTRAAGDIAGYLTNRGYRVIRVDRRLYRAAKLAWLYSRGTWPSGQMDHRNGMRSDDRLRNLRDVPGRINTQNQRKCRRNNSTGFMGVTLHRRTKRWIARVSVDYERIYVGSFATGQSAHRAYVRAKRRLHEGCTL